MTAALALLSAVCYGAADFVGGLTSRNSRPFPVVVWSQVVGGAAILALLPLVGYASPTAKALVWGAAAGVVGVGGIFLLYRGLAVGAMSIVAPLTAVLAASIPVVAGVLLGDRPSPAAWTGVAVALISVVLVSRVRPSTTAGAEPAVRQPGVAEAVGAGFCFALFFVLLDQAGDAGLWPLVGARSQALLLLVVAQLAGGDLTVPRPARRGVVVAGLLDQAANVLYLLAVRRGLLSLVAVLVSLYPAGTVVLARIVLGERLTRVRVVGVGCAVAGVVLIALG